MKKVYFVLAIVSFTFATLDKVYASGFALFEQSTRGASLGGAVVATADDASALWYNPSGITQLVGTHIMTGAIVYSGNTSIKFDERGTADTKGNMTPVPHLFCTRQMSDRIWAGVGFFAPYGLSNEYEETWEGRYNGYSAGSVCMEMNPNIAFIVTDKLSLSIGVSVQQFKVEMKQKIDPEEEFLKAATQNMSESEAYFLSALLGLDISTDVTQSVHVEDTDSFRFNFSALLHVNKNLSLGFNYRSHVGHDLSGNASYKNVPSSLSDVLYNARVKGTVTLPDLIWVGIAYRILPEITIEADILRTGWSSYNKILFEISNGIGQVEIEKNWKDVNSYRLGLEYDYSESIALRFGYVYDECPIPDNTIDYGIPSDDRHVLNTGFGYSFGDWTIDMMYCMVLLADKRRIGTRPDEGILYASTIEEAEVNQFGLSVSYSF